MSRNVRDEINSKLNIVDVVGKYLTLKRAGNRYIGLCPFHNEKTPSFSVTPDSNLFYCFGCHKGGTIFDFIMEIENMDFPESLKFLAEKAGVELDDRSGISSPDRKKRDALKELYGRVAGSLEFILENRNEAAVARDYLKARGLTDEIIKEFRIGWAPDDRTWLLKFLKTKGYSEKFLAESGLFSQRGLEYPLFSGRIMFPLTNTAGDVIGFSGRTLKDFGPKYINSPETPIFYKKKNLYGLSNSIKAIRQAGYFILCEGQMDVIAYHQAGIKNTIAPLGTAYTSDQAMLLKRYADKAVLSFDGDAAGQKAIKKAIIINEGRDIKTKVAVFGDKEDPADLLLNKGEKALHKVLKSTINSFDYILENAINVSNIRSPEGKEQIIRLMEDYLNSLSSEVRRAGCINEIAERLGVDSSSVQKDLRRGPGAPERNQPAGQRSNRQNRLSSELFLMIAVVVSREEFTWVRGRIDIDDLEDERARKIFIALEECYRNEENGIDSVLNRLADEELTSLIAEKVTSEEYSINTEELIKDSVRKIKKNSLLNKREEIVRKLKNISSNTESGVNEKDLLSEKIYIDQEIEKLRVGI
ncbi:MAG: DNA primase [Spirochaetales bacterium]|uniref:DNA primase n=1 Tax=Candidatus Thalassospirochaeta sargassi TaxID=3119039 RepID=A0AAJ1MIS4_9SPIO|nr:DNA primase [Spirochaetales bacterium]